MGDPQCLTPIPDIDIRPRVGAFKIETNLSLLMAVTTLTIDVTQRGWQLHDQRCEPLS